MNSPCVTEGTKCWSTDSVTDASTLLLAITTTDFISSLVITSACLKYLLGLTRSLQAEAKYIVQAMSEVNATLQDVRDNIEKFHDEWFATVEKMCDSVHVVPAISTSTVWTSTPSRQCSSSISVITFDVPFQYQLLIICYQKWREVSTTTRRQRYKAFISYQLGDLYSNDLPFFSSLSSEFHCWHTKWTNQKKDHGLASLPTSLHHTLPHVSSLFPNISFT